MNPLKGTSAKKAHAYAAGKKAWEQQLPREPPPEYKDEERMKWFAGWDSARDESQRG